MEIDENYANDEHMQLLVFILVSQIFIKSMLIFVIEFICLFLGHSTIAHLMISNQ